MNSFDTAPYIFGLPYMIVVIIALVLIVLWIFMPLAIFAIDRHTEKQLKQNERIIELLEELAEASKAGGQAGAFRADPD